MAVKRIRIPGIFEGMDEKSPPHLLPETKARIAKNYQIDSPLSMRKVYQSTEHDISDVLSTVFSSISSIHGPYYTKNTLDTDTYYENDKGYYILVFGVISGSYKLRLYYYTENVAAPSTWVSANIATTDLLDDLDSVTFTSSSEIETTQIGNRVIIVDGVNRPMYIYFDPDGFIYCGLAGIQAPKSKPSINFDETDYTQENFTTSSTDGYASTPGLVQVLYTVVTETGEESNPSPISLTKDMQFFRKTDEQEEAQWISKIIVENLELPSGLSDDIVDELKYFNIYARVFEYSEGSTPKSFDLAKQVLISDKDSTNSYSLSVEFESGTSPDYENDVPHPAFHVGSIGGITFYGDILRENYTLPFDFLYVCKIIITNQNNLNYVDALIEIQLDESLITNFDVSDFCSGTALANLDHIRIFDEDLTTMLPVFEKEFSETKGTMNIFVKIPQLIPGATHVLYLCFNDATAQSTHDGIDNATYRTYEYGQFFEYGTDTWADQIYFDPIRVHYSTTKIAMPGLKGISDGVINKADINMGTQAVSSVNSGTRFHPLMLSYVNEVDGKYTMTGSNTYIQFEDNIEYPVTDENMFFTLGLYFRIYDYSSLGNETNIFTMTKSADSDYSLSLVFDKTDDKLKLRQRNGAAVQNDLIECEIPGENGYYYLLLSVNAINDMGAIVAISTDISGDVTDYIYKSTTSSLTFGESSSNSYDGIVFGHWSVASGFTIQVYSQVFLDFDTYIDPDTENGMNRLLHYANMMSGINSPVGINFYDEYAITNNDFSDGTNDWTELSGTFSVSTEKASIAGDPGVEVGQIKCDTQIVDSCEDYMIIEVNYKFTPAGAGTFSLYFDNGGSVNLPESADYTTLRFVVGVNGDNYIGFVLTDTNDTGYVDYVNVYKYTHNNNISFGDTKEVEETRDDHLLKWTRANEMASPDLYFKHVGEPIERVIPAPSFLRMEYQNTMLVFTKNSVYRFILSGDPSTWSAATSQLIDEKRGYGLYAPKSLVRLDDKLFWLSEAGVIMWDSQGLQNISEDSANIGLSEDAVGWYNPDNDEYLISNAIEEVV